MGSKATVAAAGSSMTWMSSTRREGTIDNFYCQGCFKAFSTNLQSRCRAAELLQPIRRFWADRRQTGNYPETGLEEINGDFLEADLWGLEQFVRSRLRPVPPSRQYCILIARVDANLCG
jgi:hypothetical protein